MKYKKSLIAVSFIVLMLIFSIIYALFNYQITFRRADGTPVSAPSGQIFGNWTLICGNGQTQRRCNLITRVLDPGRERDLLRLFVTRGPRGNPLLVFNAIPDFQPQTNINFTVGGNPSISGVLRNCTAEYCVGIIPLPQEIIIALSQTTVSTFTYTSLGGEQISIEVPVTGFDEGFSAWRVSYPRPNPTANRPQGAATSNESVVGTGVERPQTDVTDQEPGVTTETINDQIAPTQ